MGIVSCVFSNISDDRQHGIPSPFECLNFHERVEQRDTLTVCICRAFKSREGSYAI